MAKRRILLVLFLLGILVLSGLVLSRWQQGPQVTWKGKSAQYWISRLNYFDLDGSSASAEEFLFAAGPEVVPALSQGFGMQDNWLSDRWYDLYFKLGKLQRYFQPPSKRSHYRANCAIGLGLLGQAGSNAVPALLRSLKDQDPYVRTKVAGALGRIGVDKDRVVPELIAGLSSSDANYRLACVIGLCHCLPGCPEAAKALRGLLKDPDSNLRSWAAGNLWLDDSDREATFLSLLAALKDGSATVRDRAAQSIGKMGHNLDRSAEALLVALETELNSRGNEIVIWKILRALAEIGPSARPAIRALTNLLTHTNSHTAVSSLIALSRIEPNNLQWVDQLVAKLDRVKEGDAMWASWELGKHVESARKATPALLRLAKNAGDWRTQVMAATAAWRLDPSSPNPISAIANHLAVRESGQYEIVRLLGELGQAARPAIPTLRQLRYSRGIMMHEYAEDALKQIAPEYLVNPWLE